MPASLDVDWYQHHLTWTRRCDFVISLALKEPRHCSAVDIISKSQLSSTALPGTTMLRLLCRHHAEEVFAVGRMQVLRKLGHLSPEGVVTVKVHPC